MFDDSPLLSRSAFGEARLTDDLSPVPLGVSAVCTRLVERVRQARARPRSIQTRAATA